MIIQEWIESYAAYSSALLKQLKELSALQEQIQKTEMALLNSKTDRIRRRPETPAGNQTSRSLTASAVGLSSSSQRKSKTSSPGNRMITSVSR